MTKVEEKVRTDAQANRERLLDVARGALARDPNVALSAVAKAAGVGQGTLYRHFPSREALVLGVYRKEIDALIEAAPTLLAENSPRLAFRLWCDRLAELGGLKHGISDLLHAVISDQDFQETYRQMVGVVGLLMSECEKAGEIQQGSSPEDFLKLVQFLWQPSPGPEGKAQADRLLALVFRGLGARA